MWPFTRKQRPIPDEHLELLEQIPDRFKSDGCSNSPDRWLGFDFRPYCLIHDWEHCTRCHKPEDMGNEERIESNARLRRGLRAAVPWRWGFVKWCYWTMVHYFSGVTSWDSCGPEVGKTCRHNMLKPRWMRTRPAPRGAH
jgi:hypothetical protein